MKIQANKTLNNMSKVKKKKLKNLTIKLASTNQIKHNNNFKVNNLNL